MTNISLDLDILINEEEGIAQVFVNNEFIFSMNKTDGLWHTGERAGIEDPWDAARNKIAALRTFNYLLSKAPKEE